MHNNHTAILVVDGSEVSRTIISRILTTEMENTQITTCGSGEEALKLLREGHYDLVTTALMLPDMDGLDLTRAIRKGDDHAYTPIIVVSGDADTRLLREGFNAGVTDYFDKSLGYKAFVEFIKNFSRRNAGLVGSILYVEDSKTAAMVTSHVMEKHGLKITHTTSAEVALQILEQAMNESSGEITDFDMIITDFYLKGALTGGDLLHAVRTRLHLSQQEMPVLVVTVADNAEKQAEVFHAGANDFVTKPIIEEVLIARIRSLLLIKQQHNALRLQAEEMRRIAATDSLTGVHSKRYLLDNAGKLMNSESSSPVWAMLIDIDNLTEINKTLGYLTGDHILAAVGDLLNQLFDEDGMVVRFGGEEFAVLMSRIDAGQAQERAETLRRRIEQLRPSGVDITISIGLASNIGHPELDLNSLITHADRALSAAKNGGRNRYCLYADGEVEFSSPPVPVTPSGQDDTLSH